ncbi:MAG: sigma-54 dependent transcriptional regulator [bacterium]
MANVLLIDDNEEVCKSMTAIIEHLGLEAESAYTLEAGWDAASTGTFDVVFLDVRMPDGDGLSMLPRIREIPDAPEVIIMTGFGEPDGAELAIKNGAWDYIEKPSSHEQLILALSRAVQFREGRQTRKPPVALKREGIIGESRQMSVCFDRLAETAATDANVLITGETGTGKERFAWAVHQNSSRADKPFVIVDCAALPESLAESVLFGHEKGAYTGADKARSGLIKQAHRGTLFLDEVGELSVGLQKSFLRVLDTHRYITLGGQHESESDFRLVAATNRDLDEMVRLGQFREDLLFRLRSLFIELPPLRKHPDDIKELVVFYLNEICERHQKATKGFTPEFFAMLAAYHWPGNVRELVHCMEMTYATAQQDTVLMTWHLPTHIRVQAAKKALSTKKDKVHAKDPRPGNSSLEAIPSWSDFKTENERRYLKELIGLTGWDVRKASRIASLSRPRLYELLHKHGISRPG